MNFKTIERVAQNSNKKWYLSQMDVAVLIGRSRQYTAVFLEECAIPFYRIGRAKLYFLPEILEAIEKTRWDTA